MRVTIQRCSAALVAAVLAPVALAQEAAGPMDLFIALSRGQLAAAGFVRHEATVGDHLTVWWEKGSGPALVLVHGVADQAGTWFQVAAGLADEHRVLLVDLAGHGESAPAVGPLPMTTVIEGFEAWLAERVAAGGSPDEGGQMESPTLVGSSMGAWVAMLAAHRRPELVGRVVAMNGGPLRADTGDLDLLPADVEEARRLMAALRDPGSPPTPDVVLADLVRRAETGHVKRMFEAMEDLESYLFDDSRLGGIATPVDILWGESDRFMGREYPERLLAGLPNSRLTWISRCGHLPQAECPTRFVEHLKEVLALPPPGDGERELVPPAETMEGESVDPR